LQDEARLGQAQGCNISSVPKREKATPGRDAYHDPETQLRGVVSNVVIVKYLSSANGSQNQAIQRPVQEVGNG
jgi:hypothetical protein